MANHNDGSIREYLEYQCDYAGVGLEAVTDRDIGLAILIPDYMSQWVAIRGVLQRNLEAEDRASARIIEFGADICVHSYLQHRMDLHSATQRREKNFLDAAHSMAAIGLIAPLMESLFGRIVLYFKDVQTWERCRRRVGVAEAFLQIAEDIDLKIYLPVHLDKILLALFAYRNKMFHCGLEWPDRDRKNFNMRVLSDEWTRYFSRTESASEFWFFYMRKGFVERLYDTFYDIIDGVGSYARPIIWEMND